MTTFLDNWEDSNCWDVHAPDSEGEGEAVARDVPRAVASAKGLPAKPEPLVLGAGALLALLGISGRYIKSLEEAARAVEILVEKAGHIGLDVETAKLTPYAHLGQAGLNPHLSRIRLLQLYAGGPEVFVLDLFAVAMPVLRPLLGKQFVAHNAIFDLGHLAHAGLEPGRIECTMLQANALTGMRPSLATLAETELGWRISKEQQVSDWNAHVLSQEQIEYAALDAVLVHRLFPMLDRKIRRKGRLRCYELMRDAQHPIARMQLNGCFFDRDAQQQLMRTWVADRERVHRELKTLLGPNSTSAAMSSWRHGSKRT
jgi:ribonuclease D